MNNIGVGRSGQSGYPFYVNNQMGSWWSRGPTMPNTRMINRPHFDARVTGRQYNRSPVQNYQHRPIRHRPQYRSPVTQRVGRSNNISQNWHHLLA